MIKKMPKHFLLELGYEKLCDLNVFDCNDFFDSICEEKRLSHKTLSGVRGCLSQIYQLAIDLRVRDYNPVVSSRVPKVAPKAKETQILDKRTTLVLLKHNSTQPMHLAVMIHILFLKNLAYLLK